MRIFVALLAFTTLLSACGGDSGVKSANLKEAARVNTQLGVDYLRKGLLKDAVIKLERAVEQDSDLASAHAALALAYVQLGNNDGAEDAYREALDADPNDPEIRNNFGVFLCRQKELAEAEKYFMEAARHPNYRTPEAAWTNAGACIRDQDMEKAEMYFRKALEANKDYPDALVQMAWLSYYKQDYWRSRAFLQRYDAVGQPTAETTWIALLIERALGNKSEAAAYERQLQTKFPDSEQAAQLREPSSN